MNGIYVPAVENPHLTSNSDTIPTFGSHGCRHLMVWLRRWGSDGWGRDLRDSDSIRKRSDNRSNQGRGIGDAERLERQRRITDTDDGHSRRPRNAVGRERVGIVVNGTPRVYDFKRLGVERERNARRGRDHSSCRVVFGVLFLRRVRDVGMVSTCE